MAYGIDVALVVTILFFVFFLGLVLYLRREDRREGYPLEEDNSGRLRAAGGLIFAAQPKTFLLAGGNTFVAPNKTRDGRAIAARRTSISPGSPLVPTGNPLVDGVGPAAYAERARTPDITSHGQAKIVPMRVATDFKVLRGHTNPLGMTVFGCDGRPAGKVADLWVDRGESLIRYIEVTLDTGRNVLMPMTMTKVNKSRRVVHCDAITAAQFADVPALANPDEVTLYDEERVVAYYGGGYLYATRERSEPLL